MTTTAGKPVSAASTTASPASVVNSSTEPKSTKIVDSASPSADKLDPPSSGSPASEVSLKESEGLKTSETTVGSVAGGDSGPVNDIQKKIRRAERFGVPVQLSEQDKRNSRAERFGTVTGTNGSEASNKQSEDVKRKARAERFGLSVPTTTADEEAKRKARLARFAPYSKPDTVEEEKRQARAIRFSNPPSSTSPQEKGEGNIEPEAPIAGKAAEGP